MALLQSRTALITEATTALGLAIAERFVKEGASLFLCSPQQSALESSLAQLEPLLKKGQRILTQRVDSTNVAQLVAFCVDRLQRLDCLVATTSRDLLSEQLIALMKRQKSGKIIFLSGSEPVRTLSAELSPHSISVNAIQMDAAPAQVAELALFLASPASDGVTGKLHTTPRSRLPDPV